MDCQEARQALDQADVIHDEEAVAAALDQVAAQITTALSDRQPLVLCVMTGGLVFAGQLITRLRFPLDLDYLHVTRYGQDITGGALSWRAAPWTKVHGRTVLVVDDILDAGVTLAAVRDRLLSMGAAEVLTAVFADKENGLEKPISADFVGLTVPNRYVFGMGMDVQGFWRNLPAIYALHGH